MQAAKTRQKTRFSFFIFCLFFNAIVLAQDFNKNSSLTFINHATPKSPESASFEKYGKIPVSEYTGTPSIAIPLYTVSGSSISAPISLSYHASGIKVNQEATWVGLGWDIVAGGRITLDVKGGWDKYVNMQFLNASTKKTLELLFSKFGMGVTETKVVNSVNPCNWTSQNFYDWVHNNGPVPCDFPNPDSLFDVTQSTFFEDEKNILEHGLGQPDLFHANFLGHSFTFYRDLFTDSIKIKGEQNLFLIEEDVQSAYSSQFTVTDNSGIKYFFEQEEKTYYTPYLEGFFPSITTAWLLTKIKHPNSDSIVFTYTNYGFSFPAPAISENESYENGTYGTPNTNVYNYGLSGQKIYQEPQYLTGIETASAQVEFILSNRLDIGGSGSKKLDKIRVKSKLDGKPFHQARFNYEYFNADYQTAGTGHYYFDTSLLHYGTIGIDNNAAKQLNLRLKLCSVVVYGTDSVQGQKHQFYYNTIRLPNKVSLSQDHWGYYNAQNLSSTLGSQVRFTPTINSLMSEGLLTSQYVNVNAPTPVNVNLTSALPGRAVRSADETYAKAAVLDSIIYPTGGKTKYNYELHRSFYSKTGAVVQGGGLRIKSIVNYSEGQEILRRDFSYLDENGFTSGIYLNTLGYIQANNRIVESTTSSGNVIEESPIITLFSNGNLSEDGANVGYARVVEKFGNGNQGSIEKKFSIYAPSEPQLYTGYALTSHLYTPLTPNLYSYGNLTSEKIFDGSNVLKTEKLYYYNPTPIHSKLYSVRIAQYFYPLSTNVQKDVPPYIYYFDPVFSRNTVPDSVVEKSYEATSNLVSVSSYKYNAYFQPEYVSTKNSLNEHSIIYTKTPLSFGDVPQGEALLQGNAQSISYMRANHIYDSPIERLHIKKNVNGDSSVLRGAYNMYNFIGNVTQTYLLESASPIPMNQFQKTSYGAYNVQKDSRYKLNTSAYYSGAILDYGTAGSFFAGPYIKEIVGNNKTVSYIYDTVSNTVLAYCDGAARNDIAYTSFEMSHPSNWTYTGTTALGSNAPTGKRIYNLGQAGGNLSRSGLNTAETYALSYWTTNTSAYSVTGTIAGSVKKGATINGWTYFEQNISGQSSISVSGSGLIDEVKLHPAGSSMKSFTYDEYVRMISETDIAGKIVYYRYDLSNRLSLVVDQYQNILRKICYNYAGQPEACVDCVNTSPNWQNTNEYDCQKDGSNNNTGYQLRKQVDANPCSSSYGNFQWVVSSYNTTACPLPVQTIYAKVFYENLEYTGLGYVADIKIKFFSNAACTVPVSVSNMAINFRELYEYYDHNTSSTSYYQYDLSSVANGYDHTIGNSQYVQYYGWDYDEYWEYILLPNSNYVIIQ